MSDSLRELVHRRRFLEAVQAHENAVRSLADRLDSLVRMLSAPPTGAVEHPTVKCGACGKTWSPSFATTLCHECASPPTNSKPIGVLWGRQEARRGCCDE